MQPVALRHFEIAQVLNCAKQLAICELHTRGTVYFFHGGFNFAIFVGPRAPIAKLRTAKISFSDPHTSTSLVAGDRHAVVTIHVHVEASNSSMRSMLIGRVTAVNYNYTCVRVGFRDSKTPRKFRFHVFGAFDPRNIVPAKISTYKVTVSVNVCHKFAGASVQPKKEKAETCTDFRGSMLHPRN